MGMSRLRQACLSRSAEVGVHQGRPGSLACFERKICRCRRRDRGTPIWVNTAARHAATVSCYHELPNTTNTVQAETNSPPVTAIFVR
jgi:hypothetical protein